MRIHIGSLFLLTIYSIFSILFFSTFASAQREGAGNYASGVDGQTYTLNYEDKSRKRPNDDTIGQYSLQCDDRQTELTQEIINTGSAYLGLGKGFDTTNNDYKNCENVYDRDGYRIELIGNSSGMPPMGSSSGMPPVGGQSPAQNALALAQAEKAAAEQRVTEAEAAFQAAEVAQQEAEQQLTTAQDVLASATAAEEAARQAADEAENVRQAELATAEQTLQQAQQQLSAAEAAIAAAEQERQIAEQAVQQATNEVQRLRGPN